MRDAKKCRCNTWEAQDLFSNEFREDDTGQTNPYSSRQNDNPHDILVPRRVFDGIRTDVSDVSLT